MFNKPRNNTTTPQLSTYHPFRWIVFLFSVLGVRAYFPSVAAVAFLFVALLVCPIQRVHELDFMKRMEDTVSSLGMPTNRAINVVAAVLFFLGVMSAPSNTEPKRSAPQTSGNELLSVTGDIEYSFDPVNVFEYVVCSDENAKLEATDDIVASRVGPHTVTFRISCGLFRNTEEDVELVVRDTQAPTIEFVEDSVEVEMGDAYDASSNVQAVVDPVDGELVEVEAEPTERNGQVGLDRLYDEGWYLVDEVDTSRAGEQEVSVRAVDQHGNETTASFALAVVDPFAGVSITAASSELEYSNKQLDPTKLVQCSDPDVTVTADKIKLDKVGDVKVTYTLKKGGATRTEALTFHVRDTKSPRIAIGQEELSIEPGESFDPYDNIVSVEDAVDGALQRAQDEQDESGDGWYTIQGSYDVNVPSKYYLTVIACDRNGNHASKEFSLLVNDPPAQEAASPSDTTAAPTHEYVLNSNTHKFHYPSCRDVKRMNESNKEYVTATRDEVLSWGYDSCGHCNP